MNARLAGMASLVLLASACGRNQKDAPLVVSGHVEARDVRVSAKIGGRIELLSADEGQALEEGAPVATIEDVDARLAVEVARGELAEARAQLALREAGSRREEIAEAEAQLAASRADLANAELELRRMETLVAEGTVASKARDDAAARRAIQSRLVDAASQRLARLRAGSRVEELAASQARVETLDARLRQAEQQLADTRITSPVAGVVTEKLVEQGDRVPRDAPLVVVTELGEPWLTCWVGETDLGRVRLGQRARVETDGGDSREGEVTWISPRAEFTPKNVQTRDEREKLVYRMKIALPNADLLFKPGMPAEATLLEATAP